MGYTLNEFMKTVRDPFRRGIIGLFLEEPVFQMMTFRTINGLAYSYSKAETLPVISWRKLNGTFSATQGVVNRQVEPLRIMGGDSDTDIELVRAYGNEERLGRDQMFVEASTYTFVQYLLYGNSGDRTGNAYDNDDGMDGFITRLTSGQTVDASGTSSTAGSSVFAVRIGDPFCECIQSHDLDARDLGEISSAPVYRTRIDWTVGVTIKHGKSVARIKNLDTTAKLTKVLMDALKAKIVGRRPSFYIMSDRSQQQLSADLHANYNILLQNGLNSAGVPVTMYDNVPILISDAVIDTEDNTA